MHFLIDECLSPALVEIANDAGFEAYHVAYRGWSGETDPQILRRLLDEDIVLVTNNRDDFLALLGGVEIHPGLIVIVDNVRRSEQIRLFGLALNTCQSLGSLINTVVEVHREGTTSSYELPAT